TLAPSRGTPSRVTTPETLIVGLAFEPQPQAAPSNMRASVPRRAERARRAKAASLLVVTGHHPVSSAAEQVVGPRVNALVDEMDRAVREAEVRSPRMPGLGAHGDVLVVGVMRGSGGVPAARVGEVPTVV